MNKTFSDNDFYLTTNFDGDINNIVNNFVGANIAGFGMFKNANTSTIEMMQHFLDNLNLTSGQIPLHLRDNIAILNPKENLIVEFEKDSKSCSIEFQNKVSEISSLVSRITAYPLSAEDVRVWDGKFEYSIDKVNFETYRTVEDQIVNKISTCYEVFPDGQIKHAGLKFFEPENSDETTQEE